MRRRLLTIGLGLLGALALSSPALAHDRDRDRGAPNLGCGDGKLVVNIKYTVKNDLDTTVPINNVQYDWAVLNYQRRVLVWQTGADTFCAATLSRGTFTTLAGHSPGGTTTIPAGIEGRFFGGYVTNEFHGSLKATPGSPAFGDLGVKDFACSASADHNDATKSCSTFGWFDEYFTAGSAADWKLTRYFFVYHAKGHGTWVDRMSGGTIKTRGDIVAVERTVRAARDDDDGDDDRGEHRRKHKKHRHHHHR